MNVVQSSPHKVVANAALGVAILFLVVACDRRDTAAGHGTGGKNVLTLTKDNFQAEVLASSRPVLVDFWAVWCGPCKMIAPIVAELASEFEGKAKVGKVDVDTESSLAKQYGISAIPTLLIFKDGKRMDQVVGLRSKEELKAKLNKFVDDDAAKTATAEP